MKPVQKKNQGVRRGDMASDEKVQPLKVGEGVQSVERELTWSLDVPLHPRLATGLACFAGFLNDRYGVSVHLKNERGEADARHVLQSTVLGVTPDSKYLLSVGGRYSESQLGSVSRVFEGLACSESRMDALAGHVSPFVNNDNRFEAHIKYLNNLPDVKPKISQTLKDLKTLKAIMGEPEG